MDANIIEEPGKVERVIILTDALNTPNSKVITVSALRDLLSELRDDQWVTPIPVTGNLAVLEGSPDRVVYDSGDDPPFKQVGYLDLGNGELTWLTTV